MEQVFTVNKNGDKFAVTDGKSIWECCDTYDEAAQCAIYLAYRKGDGGELKAPPQDRFERTGD